MADDFDFPALFPFLAGVYLGVNAVSDAFLVVDGPNCALFKAERIQGNHDWRSSLLRSSGLHRVMDTDCTAGNVALGADELLRERIVRAAGLPDCGVVVLTALSMAVLIGRQYDRILAEVAPRAPRPLHFLPPRSLDGDWLDGYATFLLTLAAAIELPAVERRAGHVALVGYLHDRNEADHAANHAELRHLLGGLGLEVDATWLAGGPYADLARVAGVEAIISLPYGREAARTLATRTGAQLVECDLPLGLDGTRAFVETVAAALGRRAAAAAVMDAGLRRVVPWLEFVLPHLFFDRRLALYVDPHQAAGLAALAADLGMQVSRATCFALPHHLPPARHALPGGPLVFAPPATSEARAFADLREAGAVDLVVAHSDALDLVGRSRTPFVEFGFPSYSAHAFYPTPFLGFGGTLSLVQRLANALSRWGDTSPPAAGG